MADRPKKKVQSGVVNADRPCGKAPKKHPKKQDVARLTDEQRAERDRRAAERRVAADKRKIKEELAAERRQRHYIAKRQEEAIKLNRAFDDARRREMAKPAADAIKRLVGVK